ncbi:serine threonine protein kinase : Serine/threonine protein kinase OS=Singulisphaera acidiphila (strain ATCC BAA-1392 / DSM 18658 / VKM B-2454 / MOB10) GN=Sinac_2851 PE=3 SV=1: Pkinase: WD40: WD40: WD40: WD40 [Gemmataceae bacterium]|nr:serine threonine protein kinase : Serine/threonine protein kinase OS=Singulisphaera acidiphila (strain ATCC BAA-1392 / DSM 18658 / VKM B-2454 / MOB10) GN=Sinac_2851 PE=3 SV=1: Pkinase: WD40: WD40: WD40: WD40 [Gemmataceae bacterium]VTT97756.1 serine threonine protein kinase : Serine/threonine protein kinase OS=Singulisphaera acidiphila (strain ATCC BAA-1392 / DSM 18658 / VKM B-2454 / MOB10) GN=Sinac_2851 PE=3 SV=1: Pkinase: WD40: WD40: WD40: WD40 [Gemmataceae bacterium]
MTAPPTAPDAAAPRTLGPYLLTEPLGEGGMGAVFKARHTKLGRVVAVKVIRTGHLGTKNAVRRFLRELRAVARLDHPLIVRAFDAGEDRGEHYLAMEYVDGEDLSRTVARTGPLGVAEACRVAFQVTLALQHLYESGITHRDLKPTNLLRDRATGQVKVLDLGLARVSPDKRGDDESGTMTQVGAVLGTPDYMAPEQALDSTRTDIRSDLYSLGCVLFFLLTGRPPFPGGTAVSKMLRHHDEVPPGVAELRPGVPPEVAAIVARLLAKSPADRYQTPAELMQAIVALGTVPAVPSPADTARTATEATEAIEGAPNDWRAELGSAIGDGPANLAAPSRRARPLPAAGRGPAAFALAGIAAAAALVALVVFGAGRSEPVAPADGEAPDPGAALRAAEAARVRAEAFAAYRQGLGTPAAVEAAERLKQIPSPLDALRRPAGDGPAAVIGTPGAFHAGAVNHLALSRDGKTLVSGGWDRTVRVWDAATLKPRRVLRGHTDPVHSVAVSADGTRVLGASWFEAWHGGLGFERAARVWDAATDEPRLVAENQRGGWTLCGAFTDDGHVILGKYAALDLWNIERDERVWSQTDPGMDWAGATVLSPDGKLVFTGGNSRNQVRVWDRETGKVLHRFDGHDGAVRALAANPDNVRLASVGGDGAVRVWDTRAGKALTAVPVAGARPRGVAWTADGAALVVAADDGTVRWYDPATGAELRRGTGHVGPATAVAAGGDAVFSAGEDGTIRKWDLGTARELTTSRPSHPAMRLAFVDDDRTLRVLPRLGKPFSLAVPGGAGVGPAWAGPDVAPLALAATGSAFVGRTPNGKPVSGDLTTGVASTPSKWPDVTAPVVALGPDGKRVLAAGKVVDWTELATGTVVHRLEGLDGEPCAGAVADDARLAAVASREGNVVVWNLSDGKLVRTAAVGKGDSNAGPRLLLFAPDGRIVYGFGPGETAWAFDPTGTAPPEAWHPHDAPVRCAAVAADGARVATATNDGEIAVRVAGVARLRLLKAPHPVAALAFSVDGRLLAAALADGTVALYRIGP